VPRRAGRFAVLRLEGLEDRITPVLLNSLSWTAIGPAPVTGSDTQAENGVAAGRIDVAAGDPNDANIMYIGGQDGGIWKTTNWLDDSPTWTPLTDDQPSLSMAGHDLVVFPGDSQIVYAAAGAPRGGILKSSDAGASWSYLASSSTRPASAPSWSIPVMPIRCTRPSMTVLPGVCTNRRTPARAGRTSPTAPSVAT
jgi:hypothetical protein